MWKSNFYGAFSFISTQEEAVRGLERERLRDDGAAARQLLLRLVDELRLARRARRPQNKTGRQRRHGLRREHTT